MAILFGLSGSSAKFYVLIGLGYFGVIISTIICIFRYKFYPAILISVFLLIGGFILDKNFWESENNNTCTELRNNSTCIEDECGFTCSDVGGFGFTTGAGICKDKDLNLCSAKFKNNAQVENNSKDALIVYSEIVDKIVAIPAPSSENFENQLVATYNCLEKQYGAGINELKAVEVLTKKNLTKQQLDKYYLYLSSKGRNVNKERIVAGLPAGDKNLSCEYLKLK